MTSLMIKPSKLTGEIEIPTSKSHSIRAIYFASLAHGKSTLHKLLDSPDIEAMLKACQLIGAKITYSDGPIEIEGTAGHYTPPSEEVDAGNSGQVLRFIGALAALGEDETTITGDESIRTNRPVQPLLRALEALGAHTQCAENGCAPIAIKGPVHAGKVHMDGQDSQPVSGILMLAPFLEGETVIEVNDPGEKPWIELTLSWLDRFEVPVEHIDYTEYKVTGPVKFKGFEYTVPGDFSSAAFPTAAAFVTQSKLTLKNVDLSDVQGDKRIFDLLEKMGAKFEYNESKREIFVDGTQPLNGKKLDVNDCIDAITILAVLGCYAEGTTEIVNAEIARKKECDRISCIARELKKMNAEIEERPDGLIIKKSMLKDATVDAHHDHRIAMSLAVAGLMAEGSTIVQGIECIHKSYPSFVEDFKKLGASFEII